MAKKTPEEIPAGLARFFPLYDGKVPPAACIRAVVERCAVVADERFPAPEGLGGSVHVRCDDLVEESLELAVGECDTIQGFELFPEICFKRGSIADIGAIFILEVS
jgi:hypothetical protein